MKNIKRKPTFRVTWNSGNKVHVTSSFVVTSANILFLVFGWVNMSPWTLSFGVFTNTQIWQYYHYCQLCISLYFQFHYLHHMMLVNVKLHVRGCKRIIIKGCRLHYSSSFLMVQLKQRWQYWHFCIAESLWRTVLSSVSLFFLFPGCLILDSSPQDNQEISLFAAGCKLLLGCVKVVSMRYHQAQQKLTIFKSSTMFDLTLSSAVLFEKF